MHKKQLNINMKEKKSVELMDCCYLTIKSFESSNFLIQLSLFEPF
jgi:hypothetical protein